MEISKNGLSYRFSFGYWNAKNPDSISLCRFFWWFLLGFLAWPLLIVVVTVVIAAVSACGFFIGKRIPLSRYGEQPSGQDIFVNFKHWPTIRNYRILPLHIVLAVLSLWAIKWIVIFGLGLARFLASVHPGNTSMPVAYAGFCLALLALLLYAVRKLWKCDAGKLFLAFLKARKEQVCPTIVFR